MGTNRNEGRPERSVLPAAIVIGLGLGGFVDGIVLHQLLQWHHMLTDQGNFPSSTVRGLQGNGVADGMFHVATWIAVVIGVTMLFRVLSKDGSVRRSWSTLLGGLLIGWGSFNLMEGTVDHHLLTIHHVRDDVTNPLPWDVGFLAIGAVLLLAGFMLTRRDPDSVG